MSAAARYRRREGLFFVDSSDKRRGCTAGRGGTGRPDRVLSLFPGSDSACMRAAAFSASEGNKEDSERFMPVASGTLNTEE